MSNLPAVDSVWGVVGHTNGWRQVTGLCGGINFYRFGVETENTCYATEWQEWVESTGAVDITAIGDASADDVWNKVVEALQAAWLNETLHWNESPRELITRLINERDDLATLEATRSANVERLVTWIKDHNRKSPELAFTAGPERVISDLFLMGVRDAAKYEAELAKCAEILQRVHPMGAVMGFGLLNVAQALSEVVDGASESALRELHAAIERGGLDLSCCMDCGAPVVCIPDGLSRAKVCRNSRIPNVRR